MHEGPCLNCPDRTIECHSSCQKYLSWVTAYRAEKEKTDTMRREERALYGISRHIYGRHKMRQ